MYSLVRVQLGQYADVAQMAVQLICTQQVVGSTPIVSFSLQGSKTDMTKLSILKEYLGMSSHRSHYSTSRCES